MSASATGWRSKCPYNFGGDAEACDPCPQCDADKPQSPLAASNDAEVGHGVAELQQADWHIPGPCGPENWEQRAVRRVAEVKGDPPKPPLCWICGKPLPHDCVGEQLGNASPATSAFYEYCAARDIDVCNSALQHAFETGWNGGRQSHKVQVFGVLGGYRAKVSDGQMPIIHGPPQKVEQTPPIPGASILLGPLPANSFAPPATSDRKWPIGTPSGDHYNLAWGFRLQQARAHRGLTLDALGARLNPPRSRKDISAMEHGRRGLSVELCAELAQALDCDRCWLAGWKEGS